MEAIMKKRFISLVVLLAMGTIIVSSCGQENNKPGDVTTNDNSSETTAPADDDPFEKDSLPELNFNGETINILYREDVLDSFYAAEQTGEIVGDAVYKAVRAVEDRIGVTITSSGRGSPLLVLKAQQIVGGHLVVLADQSEFFKGRTSLPGFHITNLCNSHI